MLLALLIVGLHQKRQQRRQQHERQSPTQDAEPKSRSIAHRMPVLDVYQCIPQVFSSTLSFTLLQISSLNSTHFAAYLHTCFGSMSTLICFALRTII